MSEFDSIKTSIENSILLVGRRVKKSSDLILKANTMSKYIPFFEGGGYGYSESKKKSELEKCRKSVTISTVTALKIAELISKEINNLVNTLSNNKNAYWHSSLFNKVAQIKSELNNQIFDAKSLNEKFGDKSISFNSITLEEDEYAINDYDIISMGIKNNEFEYAYYKNMIEKYGNTNKSNIDIIHNGYTQRCSSFDINRKLRKGESLNKDENKIYLAIKNACGNNTLVENKYLFRYVSQEFINKYNIEFNRLNQLSIANAVYRFKKNIIDKNEKEKEKGFISSSCEIEKNVFKSRDILLVLYVEKGCHLYATNNKEESEIIFPPGMIYHFFDCFFIEVKLLNEKCYQMVIKAYLKDYY